MTSSRPRLYFDNAATSFPKPAEVAQAMMRQLMETGASPGRGGYAEAIEAGRILTRCRDLINKLIHGESADHVVFTLHTTDALNLAIKGIVHHHRQRGEKVHIVTTRMDHNSILRPMNAIIHDGVEVTRIEVDPVSGRVNPDDIRAAIRPDTRLVATIHGSNVTGTLQPISEIGAACRAMEVPFLVDAAQTIGHLPIDVQTMNVDLLAFPGHKGLLGPLGTGGLYIRPGLEQRIDTLREGGTGTASERDVQPDTMPDKFEPGSHNTPGIAGLAAGVKWILDRGVDSLWSDEKRLIDQMLAGLSGLPGLRLLGLPTSQNRCGVFSIVVDGIEPLDLAAILEEHYGILVRAGLHCAPLAHQTMGTASHGGATRFSLGPFLTEDDVRTATNAVAEVCHEQTAASPMTHA